jgi:hypothetical protein
MQAPRGTELSSAWKAPAGQRSGSLANGRVLSSMIYCFSRLKNSTFSPHPSRFRQFGFKKGLEYTFLGLGSRVGV